MGGGHVDELLPTARAMSTPTACCETSSIEGSPIPVPRGWATRRGRGCRALNAVLDLSRGDRGVHPVQAIPAIGSAVRRR